MNWLGRWKSCFQFLKLALRQKCQNTEFFLISISPHSDWIRRDTEYLSVFSPNVGKYGLKKTPYLDTFHAVLCLLYFFKKKITFTKWKPFKIYKRCFFFHLKSSFHSQDIQIFVFPSPPLFFPVSHLEPDPR